MQTNIFANRKLFLKKRKISYHYGEMFANKKREFRKTYGK